MTDHAIDVLTTGVEAVLAFVAIVAAFVVMWRYEAIPDAPNTTLVKRLRMLAILATGLFVVVAAVRFQQLAV